MLCYRKLCRGFVASGAAPEGAPTPQGVIDRAGENREHDNDKVVAVDVAVNVEISERGVADNVRMQAELRGYKDPSSLTSSTQRWWTSPGTLNVEPGAGPIEWCLGTVRKLP